MYERWIMLEFTEGKPTLQAKTSVRWQLQQNPGERDSGLRLTVAVWVERIKCFRDNQRGNQLESITLGDKRLRGIQGARSSDAVNFDADTEMWHAGQGKGLGERP